MAAAIALAGAASPAGAQASQLANQELLRQQERERALREQLERGPDVRLPRQPGPAAAPVDATQDLPCFPVTQVAVAALLRAGRILELLSPTGC